MYSNEKRKFKRIPFRTHIQITAPDATLISSDLRDISLGGAFIFTPDVLPEGCGCVLDINLIGPASLLRIQVEGEVIRVEENGLAVKFTRIDLDSLIHLKHLIKVHTQDPSLVDDEFAAKLLEIE